ncbi:MAG TPA: YIP1 family protein [Gemmatimonadaceae bacterium]|nr:YIP1 family protein [Gemmatimonadaceae bacterium]
MTAMPQRSIVDRMRGAAMLDVATYEEVEADRSATGQAFVVVVIVAVCAGIGHLGAGVGGVIGGIISSIVGWLIWSGVTMLVGTKLFGGTADWGELLRTLGFAQSPGVLAILGLIPVLGLLVVFLVGIWQLVTGIVAIRQALDFTTGKAVLTAIVSWIVVMVVTMLILAPLGLGAAMLGGH